MVFLSIYNILYTIGKLWFPSFQWDCCQSEILTYFLSSQLSIQISYLSPVQLVLFKVLEYSRQCKIPHSKAYALLLRTDNQESCSATLGPHLYFVVMFLCFKYRCGPGVAEHDSWGAYFYPLRIRWVMIYLSGIVTLQWLPYIIPYLTGSIPAMSLLAVKQI